MCYKAIHAYIDSQSKELGKYGTAVLREDAKKIVGLKSFTFETKA